MCKTRSAAAWSAVAVCLVIAHLPLIGADIFVGPQSFRDDQVNKPPEIIPSRQQHMPSRNLIMSLTMIFGIFGLLLLLALVVLFIHFFVKDLSSFILSCFCKRPCGTQLPSDDGCSFSSRCRMFTQFMRCGHRLNAEPLALSRRERHQRLVYRPHLLASTSSPSLPACLNFRRRGDQVFGADGYSPNGNRRSRDVDRPYSIYSVVPISPPVSSSAAPSCTNRARSERRHSVHLSALFANSSNLLDREVANRIIASTDFVFQLPQPPSYDEAVQRSTAPNHSPSRVEEPQLSPNVVMWSSFSPAVMPPPPPYEEVIPTNSSINNLEPQTPAALHSHVIPTFPSSSSSMNGSNDASRSSPPIVIARDRGRQYSEIARKPEVQGNFGLNNIGLRPSNAANLASAAGVSTTPTSMYDVTHVYSWHI